MSNDDNKPKRDLELEHRAKAERYADRLMAQWGQSVGSFLHAATDPSDKSLRLQTALHTLTVLQQQQIMRCLGDGLPYHNVLKTMSGAMTHAAETREQAILRNQLAGGAAGGTV